MAMASVKSDSGFVDDWQSGKSLAECNLHMFTFEDSCDVSFRVGKKKKIVRAHRYVLMSRSCVFHAMLCGPLAEKDEISVTDVEEDNFTQLLRYLYTNESSPTHQNVTGLLYLAKKYAVGGLEHLCLTYLKSSLSAENACIILEQAHVFDEKQLYDKAMQVILHSGEKCLDTEGFTHLCHECFDKVISLDAAPQEVFKAAIFWSEEECRRQGREIIPGNLRSVLGETLYNIPFPSMDPKNFVNEVIPRKVLTSDETVIIMSHHVQPEKDPSPFRKKTGGPSIHSSVEMMKSTDVVLYNQHKKVQKLNKAEGNIDFMFNQDAVLLGIYVYGSATMAQNTYCLEYGAFGRDDYWFVNSWLLNSEHISRSSSRFKEYYIKTVYLTEPLSFQGDGEDIECLRVSMIGGEVPEYEGHNLLKSLTGDECIFGLLSDSKDDSEDKSTCNIIYGLILKDKDT